MLLPTRELTKSHSIKRLENVHTLSVVLYTTSKVSHKSIIQFLI